MKNFKRAIALILSLALFVTMIPAGIALAEGDEPTNYVDYVNPYIGTDRDPAIHQKAANFGGMVPWVSTPFGMTKWTPQTRTNKISDTAYRFIDAYITGFQATHQPAIWMGDFGYMTIMPGVDDVKPDMESRKMAFTHDDETTTPYYYSVDMNAGEDRVMTTEMTATSRTSVLRFTYPQGAQANMNVEMSRSGTAGSVTIDPENNEIIGYNAHRMDAHLYEEKLPNFKCYYVIQYSKPFKSYGLNVGGKLAEGETSYTGNDAGAYVTFDTSDSEMVEVRVGSSYISYEQARENLQKEQYIDGQQLSFEQIKQSTRDIWEDKLSTIEIEGTEYDNMVIFYTAMYHALLFPVEMSEYGRYYSAYDDTIHEGEDCYTSFSLWDTFRAENSFITLVAPERVNGMIQSLLQNYQEGGYMPKWPNPTYTNIMIGTPADSLVAEAIVKGFDGFDYDLAYEAVLKDGMVAPKNDTILNYGDRMSNAPYEARQGLTYYMDLGYVPNDKTGAGGSNTLEGAYEDWCIAQVAKAVGNENDYKYFINRSQNYKNMFNSSTKLLQTRDSKGNFVNGGYTEGSQSNYVYCVLQDIQGLRDLMGDYFVEYLDKYFASSTDARGHENEPAHHYPYLYDFCGKPWRTQEEVRKILKSEYANHPAAGLTGNDDCGQMSSWYILSALGFYPFTPASGEYMIGSPLFKKATIHSGENDFVILANNTSDENLYIQSAKLNGEPLDIPVITHEQIVNGGTVEFEMGNAPSDWGSDYAKEALPTYENVETPELPLSFYSTNAPYSPLLQNLVLTSKSIDQSKYTVNSALDLTDAIKNAEDMIANGAAYTDEQFKEAYDQIIAAKDGLTETSSDITISHLDVVEEGVLNGVYFYDDSSASGGDSAWVLGADNEVYSAKPTRSANDYYSIKFYGTKVDIFAKGSTNYGLAKISIDGGEEVDVDFWRSTNQGIICQYTSPELELGEHTIKVRVANKNTGNKNNAIVSFAYAKVYGTVNELENAKVALREQIFAAQEVNRVKFTAQSLAVLDDCYNSANTLIRDAEATIEQIIEAAEALAQAIENLQLDLANLISEAKAINIKEYTVLTALQLDDSIKSAQALLDGGEYTDEQYQSAIDSLLDAMDKLEKFVEGGRINYKDVVAEGTPGGVYYYDDAAANGQTSAWVFGNDNECYSAKARRSENDYYSVTFIGTQAEIFAKCANNYGLAMVSIDGGEEEPVDFWRSADKGIISVYKTPELEQGKHTVKVRVANKSTGNANNCIVTFAYAFITNPDETEAARVQLRDAIDEIDALDLSAYTESSVERLNNEYESALAILRNAESKVIDLQVAYGDLVYELERLVVKVDWSVSTDRDVYAKNTPITFTITTDKGVNNIALKNDAGSFMGIASKSYQDNEDGTRVWTVVTSFGTKGSRSVSVYALQGFEYVDSGLSVDLTISDCVSENDGVLYEVSAPAYTQPNKIFNLTVKTSADVSKVGLFNEAGNGIVKASESYIDEGDTRIWTIGLSISTKGSRSILIKVPDKNGEWLADGETVNVKVMANVPANEDPVQVISVKAPQSIEANEVFTITVTTTGSATKIGIFTETGAALGKVSESFVTDNDGNRKWTVSLRVGSAGKRSFMVKAMDVSDNWSDAVSMPIEIF